MKLIITANSNTCKLYQYHPLHHGHPVLTLIKTIEHPENKRKISDLISDRPGHYQAASDSRGAYEAVHDPKEVVVDQFLQEVAKAIHTLQQKQLYKEAVLIASSRLTGQCLTHLDKQAKAFVAHTIQKDMMHLPPHELVQFLKEKIV